MNAWLQVLLVTVAISLPLYHLFRAKLDRRIAANRLKMVEAVAKMETLLLDGHYRAGAACHDVLFKMLFHAQFRTVFNNIPGASGRPTSEQVALAEKIVAELNQHSPSQKILADFIDAYFRVTIYSNPIKFCSLVLHMALTGRVKVTIKGPQGRTEKTRSQPTSGLRWLSRTRPALLATSLALSAPLASASSRSSESFPAIHS